MIGAGGETAAAAAWVVGATAAGALAGEGPEAGEL